MADAADVEGHIQTTYYVLAIFAMLGSAVAAYARMLHSKIDKAAADLAAFKTEVAREYVAGNRFDGAMRQIMDAINHLGSRIDASFHYQRPAE